MVGNHFDKIKINQWWRRGRLLSMFQWKGRRMSRDTWHVTLDTWHLTPDKWHVTHGVGWTLCSIFSSLALMVLVLWCLEDWEEKDQSVSLLMSNKAVCRTAPATPGLLKSLSRRSKPSAGAIRRLAYLLVNPLMKKVKNKKTYINQKVLKFG